MSNAARSLVLCALCACGARTNLAETKSTDASVDVSRVCHDEVIANDGSQATALAVDGDVVFWGSMLPYELRTHGVSGTTTTLVTNAVVGGIVVDSTSVYYTSNEPFDGVRAVPRVGGTSSVIGTRPGDEIAREDQRLFWVDDNAAELSGSIQAVDTDGGDPLTLTTIDPPPGGLAVDATYVYFDGRGFPHSLFRMLHDGSNRVALAQDLQDARHVTLFGGRVYWIDLTNTLPSGPNRVRSVDVNGLKPKVEMESDTYVPSDLAVDESGVYVTAFSATDGALFHDGSVIASTPGVRYESVRTNATAVYWTISWSPPAPSDTSSVRKVCK